ncbi:MAG: repressor LexA [Clostridia bacterium]|nr:repressor LexA [Clostridia bacterium]
MRTLNQERLLSIEQYIMEYQKENGQSPSYRQIMNAMNMSSLNLVQRYVKALENEGRISRTKLGNIDVLPQLKPGGSTMAYLVGDIACGSPTEAIENIEECYALPKALFGDGELFILRTYGDSMIDVGIKENDFIVVRQQNTANDGDIVAALVNGESTLKRIYHKGSKIVLHPENKTMKDIVVNAEDCIIQGVLVSCIKMY